jgi:Fis family transcriptional regulator
MSAHKASEGRPLSHHVADSLDTYFRALNGHPPSKLYDLILHQVEPPLLRATLTYCRGNQSRAADMLGLNRATLRKKLRLHGIRARSTQ